MYIIVAYDIQIERIDGVRKYLKRYLNWIQNSLLEGEVTKSELEEIKNNLTKLIDMKKDHIVIYELRSNDLFIRESIGKAKLDTSNII
ncbi:MAG TPA: CRISPR-associated endonuclease Cas2 [Nitrososphaeraceae archaeon]